MEEKIELPTLISIGNIGKLRVGFMPKNENFTYFLNSGDVIKFDVICNSETALYYKGLNSPDLVVGIGNSDKSTTTTGIYKDNQFIEESTTYSIIEDGFNNTVIGEIPFEAEDKALGLKEGNRFVFKINAQVPKASLPSGVIAKVTNIEKGGFNEYKSSAFEDDGSLVVVTNIKGKQSQVEVQIQWKAGE